MIADAKHCFPETSGKFTQCKIEYENSTAAKKHIDIVWIPSKFAKVNNLIVLDKPVKRKAKVLEVYSSKDKVERKLWNNNI